MPRFIRKHRAVQLDLMQPRTVRLSWHEIPPEARKTATDLLAELLCQALMLVDESASREAEITDE